MKSIPHIIINQNMYPSYLLSHLLHLHQLPAHEPKKKELPIKIKNKKTKTRGTKLAKVTPMHPIHFN